MTSWAIETYPNNRYETLRTKNTTEALLALGEKTLFFKYKPFLSAARILETAGIEPDPIRNWIFLCSTNFAQKVSEELPELKPGVWFTKENYLVSNYSKHYSHLMLNDYTFLTLAQLQDNRWDVYQKLAQDACIFLRPDDGAKSFKGGLLDLQEFDQDIDTLIDANSPDLSVCVSGPKNIQAEWRCVCNAQGLVAAGLYKYQDKLTEVKGGPPQLDQFVQELLKTNFIPDDIFVADISLTKKGEYKLVEINSASCSGLYQLDKTKVYSAMQEVSKKTIKT